jgi:hypothetical protein
MMDDRTLKEYHIRHSSHVELSGAQGREIAKPLQWFGVDGSEATGQRSASVNGRFPDIYETVFTFFFKIGESGINDTVLFLWHVHWLYKC